jgi:hypothetical protein
VLYFSKAHEVTRGILPVKDEEFRQKRQWIEEYDVFSMKSICWENK